MLPVDRAVRRGEPAVPTAAPRAAGDDRRPSGPTRPSRGAVHGRLADRLERERELHVEPVRGELRPGLRGGAVFNTSSFIQDGPGTFVRRACTGTVRCGRIVRTCSRCSARWLPSDALTVGGYLRVQSGTPWAARGQDTQSGAGSTTWSPPGRAGTRRGPNVDLLTSYGCAQRRPGATLTVEARVLNLFGNQTQLSHRLGAVPEAVQFLRAGHPGVSEHEPELVLRDGERLRAAAACGSGGQGHVLM